MKKPFTNRMVKRLSALLPMGVPRWVRCYDNGGTESEGGTTDRFTVCFTGNYQRALWKDGKTTEKFKGYQSREGTRNRPKRFQYVGMNCAPFHPQGFGQHGESEDQIDVNKHGFAPAIGRKCHLGKRIRFEDLPPDCRRLVYQDYSEIWNLNLDSLWIARRCQPHVTAEEAKDQRERVKAQATLNETLGR